LLVVNLALLVVGKILETNSAVLVLAPILVPVAAAMGVDPVHFGLIMIINLAIGMVTPPLAVNVFAASTVGRVPFDQIVPRLLPMIIMMVGSLLVITYVPWITLYLRDL